MKLSKRTITECSFCYGPLTNLGSREFSYRTWVCKECLACEFYKLSIDCDKQDNVLRIHTAQDKLQLTLNYILSTTRLSAIIHIDDIRTSSFPPPPSSPAGFLLEEIVTVPYCLDVDFKNSDEIINKIRMMATFS